MSSAKASRQPSPGTTAALQRFFALFGSRLNDARRERNWTVQRLAAEAGVSRGLAYVALRGGPVSVETVMRLVGALGLKLEWELVDPRRRPARQRQDIVHSAMGEFEAARLHQLGFHVSIDEPYQHYQFAGRADLVAWDVGARALLHIENRTRFPDFQEAAGAFNAKRAYLGAALAERLGLGARDGRGSWRSETHVMMAVWSSEVLHAVRLRTESFRALCPDDPDAFRQWWLGTPPGEGKTSALIVLDPLTTGRQRQRAFISLEEALTARPRYAGYAELAARLMA